MGIPTCKKGGACGAALYLNAIAASFSRFGGTRPAGALARRLVGNGIRVIVGPGDGRRQHGQVQTGMLDSGRLAWRASTARTRRFLRSRDRCDRLLNGGRRFVVAHAGRTSATARFGRGGGFVHGLAAHLFLHRLGCARFLMAYVLLARVGTAIILAARLIAAIVIAAIVIPAWLVAIAVVPHAILTRTILTGTIFTSAILPGPIVALAIVARRFAVIVAIAAVPIAIVALHRLRLRTIFIIVAAAALAVHVIFVAKFIERHFLTWARLRLTALLLFLTLAVVGKDAEIMIGKLQIIFGVDPVPDKLRIARHVAVFFEKLGSVAARAIVNAVAVVATTPAGTVGATAIIVVPATIAAAGLTIVDQWWVLSFKVIPNPLLHMHGCAGPDSSRNVRTLSLPAARTFQRRHDFGSR